MKTVTFKLKGTTQMLMHNGQTKNPLNGYAKQLQKLTSKRKKTDEDHINIACVEKEAGMYYDDGLGLHLPAGVLFGCFINAAKRIKQGPNVVAFMPDANAFSFTKPSVKGEPARRKFLEDPATTDTAPVILSGRSIIRTRPRLAAGWEVPVRALLDDTLMDPEICKQIWDLAGMVIGIGDNRPSSPKKPGRNGLFAIEDFKVS